MSGRYHPLKGSAYASTAVVNANNGTLVDISGHTYRQSAGYTFETQHFPDSPNQPNFPSTELKVGQVFNSTTIYQFGS